MGSAVRVWGKVGFTSRATGMAWAVRGVVFRGGSEIKRVCLHFRSRVY